MIGQEQIADIQERLKQENIDGWLLYDFQGINPLALEFLQVPEKTHITRRIFYWIPKKGAPIQFVHAIEPHVLSHLPGEVLTYVGREALQQKLQTLLKGSHRIAMEYSPNQAIPYLSKVDAGLIEWIRSLSIEVLSSGNLLQQYTSTLDQEQLETHLQATSFLDETAALVWEKITQHFKESKPISEYQVQQFIFQRMQEKGFITEGLPICAVNAHAANPHFEPQEKGSSLIQRGDLILIDLWCRKNESRSIYGDISRVAVADSKPTAHQQEVFSLVRSAQKKATQLVIDRYSQGQTVLGYEVDQVCREVIDKAGYGDYFTHRTGHNIYVQAHGPGAHIDSLETWDERPLIPHTCFSIEPGIYLPDQFGVRLEYDVYLGDRGEVKITGGEQDEIVCLL